MEQSGSPRKDGFVSTLTRMVSILLEGRPLYGGPCQKVEIEEVDVRPCGGKGSNQDPEDPEAWEREIGKAGVGCAYVYSDGSLLKDNNRSKNKNDGGGSIGGSGVERSWSEQAGRREK